jgi:hypothetical protein
LKKFLALFLFTFLLTSCRSVEYQTGSVQLPPTPATPDKLYWKGLRSTYTHFSQIKVELLNERGNSVFLPHRYPQYSESHLERFNEATKQWELGENGMSACKSMERFIEIKPDKPQEIVVDWYKAFSHADHTKFEVGDFGSTGELRPLSGIYRLTLRYSTTPEWEDERKLPQTKSPEFKVNWDENGLVKNDKGGC